MMDVPVQLASGVGLGLHSIVDAVPDALLSPAVVASRDRGALPIAAWQVFPGCAGTQDPQNAIDDLAMVDVGTSTLGAFAMTLRRQQPLKTCPLDVG